MVILNKFIELTQPENEFVGTKERKIKVNVCSIDFYYDKHIAFGKRVIDVLESYDEINKLIEELI
jgi:hypothetical protein